MTPTAGEDPDVFVVFENGMAKRSPASDWNTKGRGGLGVAVAKITERNGDLVGALTVSEDDEVLVIMSPSNGDSVVAVARNPERTADELAEEAGGVAGAVVGAVVGVEVDGPDASTDASVEGDSTADDAVPSSGNAEVADGSAQESDATENDASGGSE